MPGFHIPNVESCLEPGSEPAFQAPSYTTDTARKYRYLFEVMKVGTKEIFGEWARGIRLYAFKASRPSPEFDEITIHSGQDEIYRPGKHRWKPIDITFYEKLDYMPGRGDGDVCADLIYDWWAKTMTNIHESRHYPLEDYMARGKLQMLGGDGFNIWSYHLLDCWPQKVSPSDLDYSDTAIAEITLTIRFSKAIED